MLEMLWCIPLRQLVARLSLIAKRRLFSIIGPWLPRGPSTSPPLNRDFQPKRDLVSRPSGQPSVELLNESLSFYLIGQNIELRRPFQAENNDEATHISHLFLIHLHSMEYLRTADDELFMRLITDWIGANPQYHQRYWHASWNSFALSIRVFIWITEYSRRSSAQKETVKVMIPSLFQQVEFLSRNLETDLRGNHLIKNIRALLWAGAFFSGERSEQWAERGCFLLRRELQSQILEDGMHFERTPSYHNEVLSDLLDCYAVLSDEGMKNLVMGVIKRMSIVAGALTHPDGDSCLFNDSVVSSKRIADLEQRLMQIGIQPRITSGAFSFPAAGYSGISVGDAYFVIKHGLIAPNHLPGHGHADIFSFEWSLGGKRMIVDKGVYEYEAGEKRRISRATTSHNTLSIDQRDQCEMWGSFRSARKPRVDSNVTSTTGEIIVRGRHDGYRRLSGKPIHHRQVRVKEDEICINDWVEGGHGQSAQAQLLLHPSCQVSEEEEGLVIDRDDIRVLILSASPMVIIETEWFPTFGKSYRTHQVVFRYGPIPGNWEIKLLRIN